MRRNWAPPTQWRRWGGTERQDESQTRWVEVVVDSCHMTSTPKVTLLQLPPSSDVTSAKRGICWKGTLKGTWIWNPKMGTLNGNLVKNLPTNEVEWGGKPGDKWKHPSLVGKLISLNKIMSLVKNLPTQLWEDWGGKPDKRSIDEKLPNQWGRQGGKPKDYSVDIVNEKTFQPGLKTGKEKPRLVERKRRGLVDEGLGW